MATGTTLITLNEREPPGEGMLANHVANRSVERRGAVAHENVAANNKFIIPTDPSSSTTRIAIVNVIIVIIAYRRHGHHHD